MKDNDILAQQDFLIWSCQIRIEFWEEAVAVFHDYLEALGSVKNEISLILQTLNDSNS